MEDSDIEMDNTNSLNYNTNVNEDDIEIVEEIPKKTENLTNKKMISKL